MRKPIETLEELIQALNKSFGLDENHTVIAVFENNESEVPIGWSVIEKGVEADYPVLTVDELLDQYCKESNEIYIK